MSDTLKFTTTIQQTGFTVIGETKVVQYTCVIPVDNPKNMRVTSTRLDSEMYKANRNICRADLAEFEDAAYLLQDQCLANIG